MRNLAVINHRFAVAALAAALLVSAPALAADNMTVKDSTGATITMRSKDVGSGLQATVHVPFDSAGGDMTDPALHALRVEGVAGGVAQAVSGSVSLTGTLPGFAATPTVNLGAAIPTGSNVIGVIGNTAGSTTAGQFGPLVQGAATSGAPSYTTGQTYPLSLDTSGNLRVNVVTGGGAPAITAAAGAFAVGSGVDGWNLTEGAKADAAYTGSGSASMVAILKGIYASSTGSIPAGSAAIGSITNTSFGVSGTLPAFAAVPAVKIDQTTPGTTNLVQVGGSLPAGTNTLGAAYGFQNSTGNVLPPAADASAAINVSTATTTQLVALSSGKKIYVAALDVIAAGTGNITFVYGTGSNCGTGTTSLTGAYNLTAQAGIAKGNGLGAVLVVPASNALCVTTSAAVQMSGSVAYAQY